MRPGVQDILEAHAKSTLTLMGLRKSSNWSHESPSMRIAVVSDIHGNRHAFDAVLNDLVGMSPDLVLHGGDLAANGAHPAEIIDQIRSLGWRGVRGNTDEMLWAQQNLALLATQRPKLSAIIAAFQEMIPATQAR